MMRISLSFRPLLNDGGGVVVVFIASSVACYQLEKSTALKTFYQGIYKRKKEEPHLWDSLQLIANKI
jgi:hypothetical protein